VFPRSHWFDTDFRPRNDAYIAAYKVLTRDHLRNTVPAATCIRPSSGLYRSISSETPTTALSLERSCAARTRRFLSAAIPFINSLSTQLATTPPSSLSGEERNIRLFWWRWPGSPTAWDFVIFKGWPDWSPTARGVLTRPPTGTPRRAMSPGEGLPVRHTSLQGSGRGCPLLRASNEHSFTVRVLRARRAPGQSLLSFSGRALREQRRLTGYPFFSYAGRGARTSNDRRQDPHHNQRRQAPVRQAQGTSPHHRKVLYFPAKIMVSLRAKQAESKRANTNK